MSDVTLHTAEAGDTTSISNIFIDNYMKDANGEYVKIYLYMLRCLGDPSMDFSIAGMADALDHTQRDVSRALAYWEQKGLLQLEYSTVGELSGICVNDLKPAASNIVPITRNSRASLATGPNHQYSIDQLQLLNKDNDVKEILFITECYLGRSLNSTEMNTVLYWYDGMRLNTDVIEYLVEYCVELGHKNIHYMNKVAVNWAENGIESVEQAAALSSSYNSLYNKVMSAFGITGRTLSPDERKYLDKWSGVYGMSVELIEEACRRTILKTGRGSFSYADSILANWHKAGASDMEAVALLDTSHNLAMRQKAQLATAATTARTVKPTDKFHNFTGHGYDFDSIETRLLSQQ